MGKSGESGDEGAGLEIVGVEAEVGGERLGAVFAAVGGGAGGVGEGQAVGVVAGVLLEVEEVVFLIGDIAVHVTLSMPRFVMIYSKRAIHRRNFLLAAIQSVSSLQDYPL